MSNLQDTHAQLFEDTLRVTLGIIQEFEGRTDDIASATAKRLASRLKDMPTMVRQELLMIMEQYQDDPDQILAAIRSCQNKVIKAADSPWAKFSRLLKGDGHNMSTDDWRQGLYILATLVIMLTTPLVIKFGLIPIFQDPASTQQVQSK